MSNFFIFRNAFSPIPRTFISLRLGRRIQLHGGGAAVKSYIHIHDVSRGELDAMERAILEQGNSLGIGPMGFGGRTTVLGVKVTLIEGHDRLLPFVDAEIAGRLQRQLETLGLRFVFHERVAGLASGRLMR